MSPAWAGFSSDRTIRNTCDRVWSAWAGSRLGTWRPTWRGRPRSTAAGRQIRRRRPRRARPAPDADAPSTIVPALPAIPVRGAGPAYDDDEGCPGALLPGSGPARTRFFGRLMIPVGAAAAASRARLARALGAPGNGPMAVPTLRRRLRLRPQLSDDDPPPCARARMNGPYEVLGAPDLARGGVQWRALRRLGHPTARRVSVVATSTSGTAAATRCATATAPGMWEIFIPHVSVGDLYKFEIVGRDGAVAALKADPTRRRDAAQHRQPGPRRPRRPRPRATAPRQPARCRPSAIYEVHAPSWRRGSDGGFPSWD